MNLTTQALEVAALLIGKTDAQAGAIITGKVGLVHRWAEVDGAKTPDDPRTSQPPHLLTVYQDAQGIIYRTTVGKNATFERQQ